MDGLLLDTEDLYTLCINTLLARYNRPSLPWSIKAKLQGRPGPAASAIFHEWAQLPISDAEYLAENSALQRKHFPGTKPLPGVPELLANLGRTRYWEMKDGEEKSGEGGEGLTMGEKTVKDKGERIPHRVHVALATSSHEANFKLKSTHLTELFSVFESHRRVLGDDPRIAKGRGKPLPDIYLLALKTINDSLSPGETPITPEECLVFEDSVPGVEAGRRAGMRVVWCPHPGLKGEYAGREDEVLAGRTYEAGQVDLHQVGEIGDGWADYFVNLLDFPYAKYGMVIPPPEVENEPYMKEPNDSTVIIETGKENGNGHA
jgi:pseudouridine 5'-phosphatase